MEYDGYMVEDALRRRLRSSERATARAPLEDAIVVRGVALRKLN